MSFNPITGAPVSSPSGTFKAGAATKALTHHHDDSWDPVTNTQKTHSRRESSGSFKRVSETSKFRDGSANQSGFNPISGKSEAEQKAAPLEKPPVRTASMKDLKATEPQVQAGKPGLSKKEYDPLTGKEKPREVNPKVAGSFKAELAAHGTGEHQKALERGAKGNKGVMAKEIAANAEADVFGNPVDKKRPAKVGGTVKKELAKNNEAGVFGSKQADAPKGTKGVMRKEMAANSGTDVFGNPVNKKKPAKVGGTVKKELAKNNAGGVGAVMDDPTAPAAIPAKPKGPAATPPKGVVAGAKGLSEKEYDPLTGKEKPRKVQAKVAGSFKAEMAAHGTGEHQKNMDRAKRRASTKGTSKQWIKSNSAADVMGNLRPKTEKKTTTGTVRKEAAKNNAAGVGGALAVQ